MPLLLTDEDNGFRTTWGIQLLIKSELPLFSVFQFIQQQARF